MEGGREQSPASASIPSKMFVIVATVPGGAPEEQGKKSKERSDGEDGWWNELVNVYNGWNQKSPGNPGSPKFSHVRPGNPKPFLLRIVKRYSAMMLILRVPYSVMLIFGVSSISGENLGAGRALGRGFPK